MALQGNKTTKVLIALSAFVPNIFMVDDVNAQATAAQVLNISASVSNPLAVTPSVTFSLNFNTFAIRGTGSYVVQPGGTGTTSSAIALGGETQGSAVLRIPQNVSFTISIPTYDAGSDILLKNAGGGAPSKEMTVQSILFASRSGMSNATSNLSAGNGVMANIKVTDPGSEGKLAIGARILFDANQVVGTYTGSFIVRVTL